MANKIGSSGFEYKRKIISSGKYSGNAVVTILNLSTKEVIATIKSDYWSTRSGRETGGSSGLKTFYGLDNRYYHIFLTRKGAVQWGQIQSDGAVIDSKRNVIKYLDFYPLNVTPTTIPTLKPVAKIPVTPVISATPAVVSVAPVPIKEKTEEISWIEMINKLIMKIKIWMINLLNR